MIKSNNPHLAGGEIYIYMLYVCYESLPCVYIYIFTKDQHHAWGKYGLLSINDGSVIFLKK